MRISIDDVELIKAYSQFLELFIINVRDQTDRLIASFNEIAFWKDSLRDQTSDKLHEFDIGMSAFLERCGGEAKRLGNLYSDLIHYLES